MLVRTNKYDVLASVRKVRRNHPRKFWAITVLTIVLGACQQFPFVLKNEEGILSGTFHLITRPATAPSK